MASPFLVCEKDPEKDTSLCQVIRFWQYLPYIVPFSCMLDSYPFYRLTIAAAVHRAFSCDMCCGRNLFLGTAVGKVINPREQDGHGIVSVLILGE